MRIRCPHCGKVNVEKIAVLTPHSRVMDFDLKRGRFLLPKSNVHLDDRGKAWRWLRIPERRVGRD